MLHAFLIECIPNVLFSCVYRLLSGIKIDNEASALKAMRRLHDMGANTVVISSTELGCDDVLVGLGSTMNGTDIYVYRGNIGKHTI